MLRPTWTLMFSFTTWCVISLSHAIDLSNVIDVVKNNSDYSETPSRRPSTSPSLMPSPTPTKRPSANPSSLPTSSPSSSPTRRPTSSPTSFPSLDPSSRPTFHPSSHPTFQPTSNPSRFPSPLPSISPTEIPTFSIEILVRLYNEEGIMSGNELEEFRNAVKDFTGVCGIPGEETSVEDIEVTSQRFRNSTLVVIFDVNGKSASRRHANIPKILRECFQTEISSLLQKLEGADSTEANGSRRRKGGLSNSQVAGIVSASMCAAIVAIAALLVARHRRRCSLKEAQIANHHFDETDIFPEQMIGEDEITHPSFIFNERSNISFDQSDDISRILGGQCKDRARDAELGIECGNSYDNATRDELSSSIASSYSIPGSLPITRSMFDHVQRIPPGAVHVVGSQDSVSTDAVERACAGGRFNCFQTTNIKSCESNVTKVTYAKSDGGMDMKSMENQINFYPSMARIMRNKISKMNEKQSLGEEGAEIGEESFMFETMDMENAEDFSEFAEDTGDIHEHDYDHDTRSANIDVRSQIDQWEKMNIHEPDYNEDMENAEDFSEFVEDTGGIHEPDYDEDTLSASIDVRSQIDQLENMQSRWLDIND